MDIDPEEFGRGIGRVVREAIEPLARRIAELELLVKGGDADQINRLTKSILDEVNGDE